MAHASYFPPREGLITSGALGSFYRRNIDIVGVYEPVGYETVKNVGTTILVAGANTDHTSFGALPHALANAGQEVKIVTIPGYDHEDPTALLYGDGFHSLDLSRHWFGAVPGAVRTLVRSALEKNPEEKIFLGGFGLGAALAVTALAHLYWEHRAKVSGLILGSPAYTYVGLEGSLGWLKSSLIAIRAYRGKWKSSEPRPPITEDMKYLERKPWTSEHAILRVSKLVQNDLQAFDGQINNPQVLLIHGGESDAIVSPQSSASVLRAFGHKNVAEHVYSSGHWVFAGNDRDLVKELVLNFVQGKK